MSLQSRKPRRAKSACGAIRGANCAMGLAQEYPRGPAASTAVIDPLRSSVLRTQMPPAHHLLPLAPVSLLTLLYTPR